MALADSIQLVQNTSQALLDADKAQADANKTFSDAQTGKMVADSNDVSAIINYNKALDQLAADSIAAKRPDPTTTNTPAFNK